MYRGPLPVGYWDIYDVMGWLQMQLVMVDQFGLNVVSRKFHPGRLATVWSTRRDFMLDSLEKKGKNAKQLDTCSAQSSARLFSDVPFHIQNFMGNRSWLVILLRFRKVLLVLGALKSNRWENSEKIMCARFEVGYLISMWAFQRKIFFSGYIAGFLVGLNRLVVDFGWIPRF